MKMAPHYSQRKAAALSKVSAKVWPVITEKIDAPADADEWAKVKEKGQLLEK